MQLLLICFLFTTFSSEKVTDINDFDSDLRKIVNNFKENIFDKDECIKFRNEAEDLAEEIEQEIEDDEYTNVEKQQINILLKKAEALEDYIASVGNCGNYIPSIDDFYMANSLVGGNVSAIITDKYCVDVISVTIGDYICYLAENNTTNTFKVTYEWANPNGMHNGNGTMGLYGKSVRHIFDNRDEPEQRLIIVSEIACAEF